MARVLVLGATGFIGGHIAKKALEIGWKVSGLRRSAETVGHLENYPINWIEGKLEDYPALKAAMTGMDYVFHAAGFYPEDGDPNRTPEYIQAGHQQMEAVLKAASDVGIKRLIYTSSLTTIGFPGVNEERLADERDHYQAGFLADNGYYEAKSAMEKMALEAAQAGNDIVILNPTLVLGPGDTKISSSQVLVLIARGQALAVPEGIINIADVRDVAQAHISAAEIGDSGERYILGGENYSIKEAAARIAITAGVRPPTLTIPTWLIDLYINLADWIPWIDFPPFQLRAYEYWQGYDTKRAQQQLNLKTRSLEETALDSIKWFSDQGVLS